MARLNKHWTNEEDLFLQNNINDYTNKELAKILKRTELAIRHRLFVLSLTRKPKQYAYYKNDEMVEIGTINELAKQFGVKKSTIYWYTNPKNNRGRIAIVAL